LKEVEGGWTWKFDPAIWQRFSMPDLGLLLATHRLSGGADVGRAVQPDA
jgi:hypothetical protein